MVSSLSKYDIILRYKPIKDPDYTFLLFRNMWNVWRTVLEENEKLARARLAAVEVFQTQIADEAKMLKSHKVQIAKKVKKNTKCPLCNTQYNNI